MREVIERDIAATDRRIDLLVYEFYGLTKKGISVVEELTNPRLREVFLCLIQ